MADQGWPIYLQNQGFSHNHFVYYGCNTIEKFYLCGLKVNFLEQSKISGELFTFLQISFLFLGLCYSLSNFPTLGFWQLTSTTTSEKESSLLKCEVPLWFCSLPGNLLSSHTELLFLSDFGYLHGSCCIYWEIQSCLSSPYAKTRLLQIPDSGDLSVSHDRISPLFRNETQQRQITILDHRFNGKSWLCTI